MLVQDGEVCQEEGEVGPPQMQLIDIESEEKASPMKSFVEVAVDTREVYEDDEGEP